MDFTGRYVIPAAPEEVWEKINDPAILKTCIPGCEQMDKTGPHDFAATATLKIGPVRATFRGKVEMTDIDAPRACTLRGEGQGGVAGFAKGEAQVALAPHETGTVLTYTAKATVGGRLAQIGQRLIDGAVKQIADDFFTRFAAAVSTPVEAAPQATAEIDAELPPAITVPHVPHAEGVPAPAREGLAPEIWAVGLVAVIVILLVLFGVVL